VHAISEESDEDMRLDTILEDALVGGAVALGLLLPDRREFVAAFKELGAAGAHGRQSSEAKSQGRILAGREAGWKALRQFDTVQPG